MTDKADKDRHAVHYSSASDDWATPWEFFAGVQARFGPFDLDPCADSDNAKAPMYWTSSDDGLAEPWIGRVWMNPPYQRGPTGIVAWVRKAAEAAWSGAARTPGIASSPSRVVALLPARTDTQWWQRWVMRAELVYLVEGRLKFGDAASGAPFPSALVVWSGSPSRVPVFGAMDRRGRIGAHRLECERCGEPYRAVRSDSRWCSPACRQAARRAAVVAGSPEPGPE